MCGPTTGRVHRSEVVPGKGRIYHCQEMVIVIALTVVTALVMAFVTALVTALVTAFVMALAVAIGVVAAC